MNHLRLIASFVFAFQTPLGVIAGIEFTKSNWFLVAICICGVALLDFAAWWLEEQNGKDISKQ